MAFRICLRPLPPASRSAPPSYVITGSDEPIDMGAFASDLRAGRIAEDAWTERLVEGPETVEVTGAWPAIERAFAALGWDTVLDPRPAALGGARCWYCHLEPPTEAPRGRPACGHCAAALREEGPPLASVRAEVAREAGAAS
jgi:hypothetical protein